MSSIEKIKNYVETLGDAKDDSLLVGQAAIILLEKGFNITGLTPEIAITIFSEAYNQAIEFLTKGKAALKAMADGRDEHLIIDFYGRFLIKASLGLVAEGNKQAGSITLEMFNVIDTFNNTLANDFKLFEDADIDSEDKLSAIKLIGQWKMKYSKSNIDVIKFIEDNTVKEIHRKYDMSINSALVMPITIAVYEAALEIFTNNFIETGNSILMKNLAHKMIFKVTKDPETFEINVSLQNTISTKLHGKNDENVNIS